MKYRYSILFCVACLVPLSLGCSNKQSLGGRVTFSDDGSPVPACTIFFTTDSHVAQGNVIKPDGTYVVGSTGLKDGIPYGEYQVYIVGGESVTQGKNGENVYSSDIDPKYRKPETSGLTFVADGKTRKFDIVLDRKKQGR